MAHKPVEVTEEQLSRIWTGLAHLRDRLEPKNAHQIVKGFPMHLGPNEIKLYTEVLDEVLHMFELLKQRQE